MNSNPAQNKRKERDVMKLMISNYEVAVADENNPNDFTVIFKGPRESPYEEGIWKVHVLLPDQYPYKSPSIGFLNRIFHPNIDEISGSVCLDVINQTWSPMYELINIFDTFLPQLLLYPNPTDPLNGEAARIMLKEPERYKAKVQDYVNKYAKEKLTVKGDGNSLEKESQMDGKDNNIGFNDGKHDSNSEASELSMASEISEDN